MVELALLDINEIITREKHHSVILDSTDNKYMQTNVTEVLRLRPSPAALDDELEIRNSYGQCGNLEAVIATEESFLAPKSTDIHKKNISELPTLESELKNVLLVSDIDNESPPNFCFLSPLPTGVEKSMSGAESRLENGDKSEIMKTVVDSAIFISTPDPVMVTITEEQKEKELVRIERIKSNGAKTDRIRYMKLNDFDTKKEFCVLCRAAEQRLTSETFIRLRSR